MPNEGMKISIAERPTTMELLRAEDALVFGSPDKPVSSTSRWSDEVWWIDTADPGHSSRGLVFTWRPALPVALEPRRAGNRDPASLSDLDEVDAAILEDLRRLVWLAMHDDTLPFCRKPASVTVMAAACSSLMRFMRARRLGSFRDLTPEACDDYLETLIVWVGSGDTDRDADAAIGTDDDRSEGEAAEEKMDDQVDYGKPIRRPNPAVSEASRAWRRKAGDAEMIWRRIALLGHIWRLRDQLAAAGVPVPVEDPLRGENPGLLAGTAGKRIEDGVPPLPDEVFLRVVNTAASILTKHADELLAMQDVWLAVTGGIGTETSRSKARDQIAQMPFARAKGAWPEDPRSFAETLRAEDGSVAPGAHPNVAVGRAFRHLLEALRAAACIVILACTGMRVSEIVSLPGGRSRDGLPDCISVKRSDDGMLELFFVSGELSKDQLVPVREQWLIGSRAAGSSEIPIAVQAVDLLERLASPWRHLSDDPVVHASLFVDLFGDMPASTRGIARLTKSEFNEELKRFYERFVDFASLADVSASPAGVDLRPYKETLGRCIRIHQFRKNFAKFVFRFDARLLPALKRQFKHMLLATTRSAYVGRDLGLLASDNDERTQSTIRAMTDLIENRVGFGRFAELVDESAALFAAQPAPEITAVSMTEIVAAGASLIPGAHGSCAIEFAPERSRCNAASRTASFLNTTPDFARRGPETCVGCELLLVGPGDIPFWRRRYLVNLRTLRRAERRGVADMYRRAGTEAARALAVLKKLGYGRYVK